MIKTAASVVSHQRPLRVLKAALPASTDTVQEATAVPGLMNFQQISQQRK